MARNYLKEKQIHFWLDYMVLFATFNHETIFDSINFTNSNDWELEDYVYSKENIKRYIYWINFNYKNYKVFSYVKGDTSLAIPTKDAITLYVTAFKLLSLEEINYFLQWYFTIEKLKRFDICFDLKDDIKNVLKKFKTLRQKWGDIYWKKWEVETHYIWNPKKSENRNSVIRIYNKHQDLKNSRKEKLYIDYFKFDNVTRVEIEFRRNFAEHIDYLDLFIEDNLKTLFKSYISKHTHIFDNISNEKIVLYRKPKEIWEEELQSIYYQKLFKKSFIAYAKRILQVWACPVKVLISENILKESTREYFGNEKIYKMYESERNIKNGVFSNQWKDD